MIGFQTDKRWEDWGGWPYIEGRQGCMVIGDTWQVLQRSPCFLPETSCRTAQCSTAKLLLIGKGLIAGVLAFFLLLESALEAKSERGCHECIVYSPTDPGLSSSLHPSTAQGT